MEHFNKKRAIDKEFYLTKRLNLLKKIFLSRVKLEKKKHKKPFPYFKDIFYEMLLSKFILYSELKNEWLKFVESGESKKIDLYIHIPFCKSKCNYCQYFSYPLEDYTHKRKYINYLRKKFSLFKDVLKNVSFECVYVGGGSPTIFSEKELEALTKLLNENINLKEGAFERTFECRFEDITEKKLQNIEKAGFNRISFGIQSFNKKTLDRENRAYISPEKIKEFVKYCKSNHNFEINTDLIMGLGFDTENDILNNVEQIVKVGIDTITLYTIQDKIQTSQMYKNSESIEDFYGKINNLFYKINDLVQSLDYLIKPMGQGRPQIGFILIKKNNNTKNLEEYSNNPTHKSTSIFALGWGAKGRVKNWLEYRISDKKHFHLYDPWVECSYVSAKLEKIRFIASSFKRGFLVPNDYFNVFGSEIEKDFRKELSFLLKKGIIKRISGIYYWNTNNTNKRIFYFGIFYPEDDLKRIKLFD